MNLLLGLFKALITFCTLIFLWYVFFFLNVYLDCFYRKSITNASIWYPFCCSIPIVTKVSGEKLSGRRQNLALFYYRGLNILRSNEAKVPDILPQNGCDFRLFQVKKHGKPCRRVWKKEKVDFWTGLILHLSKVQKLMVSSL